MDAPARKPQPGEIPLIDIAGLRDGSDAAAVSASIGAACRGIGFFCVAGHGVDAALRDAVRGQAAMFFALPEPEKRAVSIENSHHNRGYVALEAEKLDPSRGGDLKEAFNIGRDVAPGDPDAGKPFCGPNQWPARPAGFADAMRGYFGAMHSLGRDLHRAFARDLGLDPDHFETSIDRPLATLRLLHYPAPHGAPAPGRYGAAPHTDYGNVTILWQDDTGGLEIRARDGGWIEVPPVPGAFVCNIGDCLMRWSNGIYVSTPHRVAPRPGRARYSIAFFLDPNGDARVECLPGCSGPERPVLYPPTTGADYLRARLDATYAFRQG